MVRALACSEEAGSRWVRNQMKEVQDWVRQQEGEQSSAESWEQRPGSVTFVEEKELSSTGACRLHHRSPHHRSDHNQELRSLHHAPHLETSPALPADLFFTDSFLPGPPNPITHWCLSVTSSGLPALSIEPRFPTLTRMSPALLILMCC